MPENISIISHYVAYFICMKRRQWQWLPSQYCPAMLQITMRHRWLLGFCFARCCRRWEWAPVHTNICCSVTLKLQLLYRLHFEILRKQTQIENPKGYSRAVNMDGEYRYRYWPGVLTQCRQLFVHELAQALPLPGLRIAAAEYWLRVLTLVIYIRQWHYKCGKQGWHKQQRL